GLDHSAIELGDAAVYLGRPRGFGVLVHLGIETLQQRSSEGRAGLTGERERVLQNLCGFAFHRGDFTCQSPFRTAMSTHERVLSIRTFAEVPDTTLRGMWRGRWRQGGLIPLSWG